MFQVYNVTVFAFYQNPQLLNQFLKLLIKRQQLHLIYQQQDTKQTAILKQKQKLHLSVKSPQQRQI